MAKLTFNAESERFQSGTDKYATYLNTPEGRLRLDLAFANLQEFLPQSTSGLRALDLGCGTGAIGVRLARLGFHVTLLDSSSAMLDISKAATQEAGVTQNIGFELGDATQIASLFPAASFDVIVCHNLLEYVDDPATGLCSAARALRGPSAILSVLVRNQAGEVLKSAIKAGDLASAEDALTSEWGHESLYGGEVRLFNAATMHTILQTASLTVTAERGVRVVSDYLPSQASLPAAHDRIFELERKLGQRPEFAGVARYTQYLARSLDAATETRA